MVVNVMILKSKRGTVSILEMEKVLVKVCRVQLTVF
jgi:hypothetical protein